MDQVHIALISGTLGAGNEITIRSTVMVEGTDLMSVIIYRRCPWTPEKRPPTSASIADAKYASDLQDFCCHGVIPRQILHSKNTGKGPTPCRPNTENASPMMKEQDIICSKLS
jgi:hypothetical protein